MNKRDNNMKQSIWISYDLSVNGDYEGLYVWLDNHDAMECGDSMVFIQKYEYSSNLLEELKKDIQSNVELGQRQRDRIYLVYKDNKDGNIKGNFLFGKRKANPWKGRGSRELDTPTDE
jgi:hypothetical protein